MEIGFLFPSSLLYSEDPNPVSFSTLKGRTNEREIGIESESLERASHRVCRSWTTEVDYRTLRDSGRSSDNTRTGLRVAVGVRSGVY